MTNVLDSASLPVANLDEQIIMDLHETSDAWFLWWCVKNDSATIEIDRATVYRAEDIAAHPHMFDDGLLTMAVPKALVTGMRASVISDKLYQRVAKAALSVRNDIEAGKYETVLAMNAKTKQTAFDNQLLFWCPNGNGYTSTIERAWQCPYKRALEMHDVVPVPIDIAREHTVSVVKKTDDLVRRLRDQAVALRLRGAAVALPNILT